MQHLILVAALLLMALAGRAQSANPAVWCPPGATWSYGWASLSTTGTVTVSYARDTVVGGQPAQLLARRLAERIFPNPASPVAYYRLPAVVTRTVADRVDVWANGQFYPLYDFAAPPGSSWLTPRVVSSGPCPNNEVVRVVVDSAGTRLLAGRSLRWFRAHLTSATGAAVAGNWSGRIYEQLGHLGYLQPQSPTCIGTDPDYIGPLGSYQAAGQPGIGYNAGTGQLLSTTAARMAATGFAAYPNPSAGLLTLEVLAPTAPTATLRLLDLAGRTVRQLPMPANRQLDVTELPAGTYTLMLESAGQPVLARRLVVE